MPSFDENRGYETELLPIVLRVKTHSRIHLLWVLFQIELFLVSLLLNLSKSTSKVQSTNMFFFTWDDEMCYCNCPCPIAYCMNIVTTKPIIFSYSFFASSLLIPDRWGNATVASILPFLKKNIKSFILPEKYHCKKVLFNCWPQAVSNFSLQLDAFSCQLPFSPLKYC